MSNKNRCALGVITQVPVHRYTGIIICACTTVMYINPNLTQGNMITNFCLSHCIRTQINKQGHWTSVGVDQWPEFDLNKQIKTHNMEEISHFFSTKQTSSYSVNYPCKEQSLHLIKFYPPPFQRVKQYLDI